MLSFVGLFFGHIINSFGLIIFVHFSESFGSASSRASRSSDTFIISSLCLNLFGSLVITVFHGDEFLHGFINVLGGNGGGKSDFT